MSGALGMSRYWGFCQMSAKTGLARVLASPYDSLWGQISPTITSAWNCAQCLTAASICSISTRPCGWPLAAELAEALTMWQREICSVLGETLA
jgi:hypothetical protein